MQLSDKDKWYPAVDSGGQVVGRFKWADALDVPESRKRDEHVYKKVIGIEIRVIGSADESFHVVKPHNEKEYRMRFPQAWAAFQGDAPPIVGTPLAEMGFDAEQIIVLQIQGISSIEQLAGASDAVCQSLGFGWRAKRDKAKAFLAARIGEVRREETLKAPTGPSTDELLKQIAALSAQVAALTEAKAPNLWPSDVGMGSLSYDADGTAIVGPEMATDGDFPEDAMGAPRRRGRPPKSAAAA